MIEKWYWVYAILLTDFADYKEAIETEMERQFCQFSECIRSDNDRATTGQRQKKSKSRLRTQSISDLS